MTKGKLPSSSHRLLLTAALARGVTAQDAWHRWSAKFDLDSLDAVGFWILPLLYKNLTSENFQNPEKPRLAGVYKQIRLGNTLSYPHLLDLLEAMQKAETGVIPGPITSLALVDRDDAIPNRPIELLIPANSLEKADRLLRSRDWIPLVPAPQARLRPFISHVRYIHVKAGELRLTWRPFGLDCSLDQDGCFWQRSAQRQANGATARLASPGELLLMACQDKSLMQIAVLLSRLGQKIDWRETKTLSRELGQEQTWRALVGTGQPELIHGVPVPIMQGQVDEGFRPGPDESASLGQLAKRHRRRFNCCTPTARPPSYTEYIAAYYQYTWQASSKPKLCQAAIKKTYGRLTGTRPNP